MLEVDKFGMTAKIRVALADKDYLVAQSLALLLEAEPDMVVTGIYSDSRSLLCGLATCETDVVVVDPMDASLIWRVRGAHPRIHVIIVTASRQERHLFEAVRAGVRGYISKSAGIDDLRDAVRAAAQGLALLGPREAAQLMDEFARQSCEETGLTPRQREILSGLVRGKTDREIAADLALTEKTVKNYMHKLFCALGVRNRTDAAVRGLQMNLLYESDWAFLEESIQIRAVS